MILNLLLLEGCASRVRRALCAAGADGNLRCGTMRIAVVIFAITDVAADALQVLLIAAAMVSRTVVHELSLPLLVCCFCSTMLGATELV